MFPGTTSGPAVRHVDTYVVARPQNSMGMFRTEAYSKSDIFYKRDNYHRWPWTAILITCLVSGVIFLYIGKKISSEFFGGLLIFQVHICKQIIICWKLGLEIRLGKCMV